jgi:hypothetical protein
MRGTAGKEWRQVLNQGTGRTGESVEMSVKVYDAKQRYRDADVQGEKSN